MSSVESAPASTALMTASVSAGGLASLGTSLCCSDISTSEQCSFDTVLVFAVSAALQASLPLVEGLLAASAVCLWFPGMKIHCVSAKNHGCNVRKWRHMIVWSIALQRWFTNETYDEKQETSRHHVNVFATLCVQCRNTPYSHTIPTSPSRDTADTTYAE